MPTIKKDGAYYVEWNTPDFRAKCSMAGIDQEALNGATKAGTLKAIHQDGKWYYGLKGLNHNLPLPEGRGWQD